MSDNSFATARPIPLPNDYGIVEDRVDLFDPVDYFSIDVSGRGIISITLQRLYEDLDLYVYDDEYVLKSSGTQRGAASEGMTVEFTGAQTVYIAVDAFAVAESDYVLQVQTTNFESWTYVLGWQYGWHQDSYSTGWSYGWNVGWHVGWNLGWNVGYYYGNYYAYEYTYYLDTSRSIYGEAPSWRWGWSWAWYEGWAYGWNVSWHVGWTVGWHVGWYAQLAYYWDYGSYLGWSWELI
ncbi:MAG: hypothetical protein AAF903_06350 [Pseudomonadota bacterium]